MSQLETAFSQIEAAAISGERCPMSHSVPGGSKSFSLLAREGRIRVEVFMHNYRVVTILAGVNAGEATKSAPADRHGKPARPYLVVGREGTRRNGVLIDTGCKSRLQPSIRDYSGGS